MNLLDIGGGFCSGAGFLDGVPSAVNSALAEYFPVSMGVQIIAEPGRSATFLRAKRLSIGDYCTDCSCLVQNRLESSC